MFSLQISTKVSRQKYDKKLVNKIYFNFFLKETPIKGDV